VQPGFAVKVLPLKTQVLLTPWLLIMPLVPRPAPGLVFAVPHRAAVSIGELFRQPAQIDLMQVAAAVIQMVELALIGQGQGFKVAQFVILVLQQAGAMGLAKQLPEGIVGVVETLFFTLNVGEIDRQQVVGVVVGILGDAIVGAFADQAAEGVTLEMMYQWRVRFGAVLAVQTWLGQRRGNMVDAGNITQRVVLVDAPAAIQVLLGQQAVQRVPLEAVAFVVFIAQVQQAIIGVVAKLDGMAEGIDALDQPATAVITQAGDALGRVGVGGELAGGVDVVAVDTLIRALAFDQITAGVVAVTGVLAAGVDGFARR
jgi:hypothetical protein